MKPDRKSKPAANKTKPAANSETPKPFTTWIKEVRELEADDPRAALSEYKKMVRTHPLKEEVYDRMMILYRREKNYEQEMQVIIKAVKAFQEKFGKQQEHLKGRKLVSLSKSLLLSTGLADKKGNPVYEHEPIARWNKRKKLVEKRLKNFA